MASHPGTIGVPTESSERAGRLLALRVEWWAGGARLAAVSAQLALVLLVLQAWQIESRSFRWHFVLICAGFLVNHLLPARLRLGFFATLSLATIGTLMGLANFAYIVGIGLVLIAVCHLAFPFWVRVALLAVIGIVLAVLRQSALVPAMSGVWPILGSMFMFRLLVYLHDLRTGVAPFGPWRAVTYFFMLPNAFFPLFPLVDYKTFNRTYYNAEAFGIYQKGVDWIVRGVIQLLAYRFVYQNLVVDPHEVADAGGVARYLVANFLLYLRVSGNFHLIVGILHLFGFNLPETHHRYLLSSSFTDFWRRINIYWKDFIQKMFFFPLYFRLKKGGELYAIAAATCLAFFATWALHAYQWFWLRGRFFITWQDVSFWAILALGVLVNVLYEAKHTRRLQSLKVHRTWRGELGRAARTIAMFTFICLLWSLWNAPSLGEWLSMLSMARFGSPLQAAWIAGGLLLLGGAAIAFGRSSSERTDAPLKVSDAAASREFWLSAAKTGGLALALWIVSRDPQALAPASVADTLMQLTSDQLNQRDVAKLERGYYEDLLDEERFNPALAEIYTARPFVWGGTPRGYTRTDNRFPIDENVANARVVQENGTIWTTNRFGMRDRDYTRQKPAKAYRIALVGDSNSVGLHVADEKVFEYVVEARLNRPGGSAPPRKYEILNFSIPSYGLYARLRLLPRVLEFQPDALLCVGVNELDWVARDVGRCLSRQLEIPDPFVADVARRAGLKAGTVMRVSEHRLEPYSLELAQWCYQRMADECRPRGIRLFAAFLPRLDDRDWEKDQLPLLIRAAEGAGFTVLDLTGAYESVGDRQALWAFRWDAHPNARGHQLIAELLYEKLEPLLTAPSPMP
jgi:hypothetical protein